MSLNKLVHYLLIILFLMILYLIIGSILPCFFTKEVSKENKENFSKTKFTNSEVGPDRATIIETPTDALNIRMEMVRNAKETLYITTYKIKDSNSTRAFLDEIMQAADRGVNVKILLDGKSYFYGINAKNFLNVMNDHPNIECRVYNPVNPLKPWNLQLLLHDKIIIADNEFLLLGGRNIDERHFAPKEFKGPITHDREIFVWNYNKDIVEEETAIKQVDDYFESLWNFEHTSKIKDSGKDKHLLLLENTFETFKKSNSNFFEKTLDDFLNRTVETNKITLIYNPIDVSKKEPHVAYQLRELALKAKKSVILQTPYSTGNKDLLSAMEEVSNNVPLVMQTNSPASTPNIAAFSNYYGHRKKFIETGASIYEYQSKDSIHGKSIVIDDNLAIVGSCNMDDRSFYLDTETMLVVDSKPLTAELTNHINNLKNNSLKLKNNNEYEISNTVNLEEVPKYKIFLIWTAFIIMRPFQFLI